jgi:hypothetical protein
MKKTQCSKCLNFFANKGGNYNKHVIACSGVYKKREEIGKCEYCNEKFPLNDKPSGWMANHVRWCVKNPKAAFYKQKNNAQQLNTPEARKKALEGIKKAHLRGAYVACNLAKVGKPGVKHTEATKKKMREKALASTHRRLQRNILYYKDIMMDSSWEVALAKRLDALNIKWIRPRPIQWIDDSNNKHHYFPDFYLIDYDVYLDPKNPAAIRTQSYKLMKLHSQYDNIVILKSLKECEEFIPYSNLAQW